MTREELYLRLDGRPTAPDAAAAFDRKLWEQIGATRAILVTDLSGFTRITRDKGIVHFLGVFRRAAKLIETAVNASKGRVLKTAADNVIALFPDAAPAIAAAQAALVAAAEDNRHHAEDRHVKICSGVGYGRVLLLEDDCFGDEVNVSFKLGEDVAAPGEILVSDAAASRLKAAGGAGPPLEGPLHETTGNVTLAHWRVRR